MAKKQNVEETRTSIDNLNDSLTNLPARLKESRKIITVAAFIVAVIVAAVLVYLFAFRAPGIKKADSVAGMADIQLITQANDSLAIELYSQAADAGYDSGNRARLQAAILLYNQGNYAEALKMADDYSPKDNIIGAAAYSLKGDCYVNLDNLDDAVSAFKKAISQSDKNEYYTPLFMLKLGRVYEAQGKWSDAADLYQQIMDDYPVYNRDVNNNVEKLLARARLMAK